MSSPITHFGADALSHALAWLREQGVSRPLILCGPSQRFVDEVEAGLTGLEIRRFTEAEVHVPRAKVEAARAALSEHEADAIVSVGGGSATGLGKALRLEAALPFVALPTTYAGSEMTRIYGITEDGDKQTGRDDRVRPDVVAYVPGFLDSLPRRLTVQSLLNAMAHPASALSTGELSADARAEALEVIELLMRAVLVLSDRPRHRKARVQAARGASRAAAVLDAHPMGLHHRAVHALGGRFGLPHAALHAAMLPATLAALVKADPSVYDALPESDPIASLFDALHAVGGATSVAALGVKPAEAQAALSATVGEHPSLLAGLLGRRPSRFVRWQGWDHGPALSVHGDLATATDVVIAVHGRGATADSIVQRAREISGDGPGIAIVAPQAPDTAWVHASYLSAWTDAPDAVRRAFDTIREARAWARRHAPGARLHLLGFSQGACLALELLAHDDEPSHGTRWSSVIAIAGARVGPAKGRPAVGEAILGVPVLVGKSAADRWIDAESFESTVAELTAAGAEVEVIVDPGDAHEISGRQRIRARELLLGRSAHEGSYGFGNAHESEALPGALPRSQNSPRLVPYGLYAEQLSGTGFVAERHANQRAWLYRLRPAAGHRPFEALMHPTFTEDFATAAAAIDLVGHRPLTVPDAPTDFVDGLHTYGGQGRAALRRGFAIHLYVANRSMEHRAFYDADGDLMVLPQQGALTLRTELGILDVAPGQLAIIPRGIAFSVLLHDDTARGYVGEVYGRHFELPDRGVVGANGLADERHFRAPSAWFEDRPDPGFRLSAKLGGRLHQTVLERSPFDVVAWHGNYVPYVYDLSMFSPVSNVAFDHIDPSAYLVLTAPLDERGADSLDLVAFPARWDPTEHTFRPPFFHRNAITEFNGIVRENLPEDSPFAPGMSFLTPAMTAHGVLDRAVESAIAKTDEQADRPSRSSGEALWFQFETSMLLSLSQWAQTAEERIEDWPDVWGRYRGYYVPPGAETEP